MHYDIRISNESVKATIEKALDSIAWNHGGARVYIVDQSYTSDPQECSLFVAVDIGSNRTQEHLTITNRTENRRVFEYGEFRAMYSLSGMHQASLESLDDKIMSLNYMRDVGETIKNALNASK